ncbi:MAG: helix-turn-helix domain-containing protein [Chloroflexia bacterium]|jgi:transcriptional regulator with XRE-family HTH domain|nr:helix-turn-helix domain-containing protein [Chloroflexia bacterium]
MQETLGTFIRERRMELGLTQEELAERVGEGVRQSEISRLEHDRVTLPRRARLEQIAAALDVSMGDLMVRTGWMDEENRSSLSDDPSEQNGLHSGDLPGLNDPVAISAQSLEAAMEALSTTQDLVAHTAVMLDEAERTVATALRSLKNERGPVKSRVGVIRQWETSTVFRA